jgi:CheY-like chemotaxis protein
VNILKNKHVLIVDDTETNRKILSILCRKWGMIPVVVECGAAAMKELAGKKDIKLVLLDMHMPEMDGLALAREIRGGRSKKELPIIMLSSHGSLTEIASIKDFVNEYLSKPIKQSLLLEAILKVFDENGAKSQALIDTVADRSLNETLGTTNPLSILLAEDNKINQKVALKALEKMGYSADVARNGREAVEAVAAKKYDIVLMDVHMPEMDGLEATRKIIENTKEDERPVIIAMTANAMDGDREMCACAGMRDYISKPISVKELQNKLERWSSE